MEQLVKVDPAMFIPSICGDQKWGGGGKLGGAEGLGLGGEDFFSKRVLSG